MFQDWVNGTLRDDALVETFDSIRDSSVRAVLDHDPTRSGCTLEEYERIAFAWHRVIDHETRFWDRVLAPDEVRGKYGMGGTQ